MTSPLSSPCTPPTHLQEFDVEIGLVTLEAGVPKGAADPSSVPRFKHHCAFPVENRKDFGIDQKPTDISKMLRTFKSEKPHTAISDWHALLYLAQVRTIPLLGCSLSSRSLTHIVSRPYIAGV
jgi:hypothetical protein